MKYEIVKTADDGYLVYNGTEVTRYDKQQRLRGPLDVDRYIEVKEILGNCKIVEGDHRVNALKNFVESEKELTNSVLKQREERN